jgi:CheY-like chemotaxis protein/chemotaxis signal transduction protein
MGLPHVVVVDDSEAILALTRSVLAPHYAVSTAKDGREGLALITRVRPEAVVLDLSMPEMDGEQVLAHLKASPELSGIPVVVISSEQARAEACLAKGATAHLVKPVRADELIAVVGRALEAARTRAARGSLAVLPLGVGPFELAVPLADVRHVLLQIAATPLPGAPSYLAGFFELFGEPICILDLATRLGVEHDLPLVDRKLVVVERDGLTFALCADRVRDPEDVPPNDIRRIVPDHASIEQALEISGAVHAVVKTSRGALVVIRPDALLSRNLLRSMPELLRQAESR